MSFDAAPKIRRKTVEASATVRPESFAESEASFETFQSIFRSLTPSEGAQLFEQFSRNNTRLRGVPEFFGNTTMLLQALFRGEVTDRGYIAGPDGKKPYEDPVTGTRFKPRGALGETVRLSSSQRETLLSVSRRSAESVSASQDRTLFRNITGEVVDQGFRNDQVVFELYRGKRSGLTNTASVSSVPLEAVIYALEGRLSSDGFVQGPDGKPVLDEQGFLIKPTGLFADLGRFETDERQALAEIVRSKAERTTAQQNTDRVRFALRALASNSAALAVDSFTKGGTQVPTPPGNIEPRVLIAVLNGRTNRDGFLLDDTGKLVQDGGGNKFKPSAPFANMGSIPAEERQTLIRIALALSSDQTPLALRQRLELIISGSNEEILDEMARRGRETREQRALIESALLLRRQNDFQQGFWELQNNGPDLNELSTFVNEFQGDTPSDIQLKRLYGRYVLENQREARVVSFARNVRNEDYELGIGDMRQLATSPLPPDQETAATFSDFAYRQEFIGLRERVYSRLRRNASLSEVFREIDSAPKRPLVGEIDYVRELNRIRDEARELYRTLRYGTASEIRSLYPNPDTDVVLSRIEDLSDAEPEEAALREELFEEYRNYVAANRPSDFTEEFKTRVNASSRERLRSAFVYEELGSNPGALVYLRENFFATFFPLFQSLRSSSPRLKKKLESYIVGDTTEGMLAKLQYVLSLRELSKERELTKVEEDYIRSVERLSKFNPYLVAIANEAFGLTSEYMRNHNERISSAAWAGIEDGGYVPLLQIGTGPNGVAALAALVRKEPALAAQTLVVDDGEQPGGPFAIPGGRAWGLNSASFRGTQGPELPDAPNPETELSEIRAYAGPVAEYPGARKESDPDAAVRTGRTINAAADYLHHVDYISDERYPTNEEFQVVLSMQAAMLSRNISLKTRVALVEPAPTPEVPDRVRVTLEKTFADGRTETKKVHTDGLILSPGFGKPYYGFDLRDTRAERVMQETKALEGFPRVSTTLEAFRSVANRTEGGNRPPRTLVLSGAGNSTDVMLEYLGELFVDSSSAARGVEKIYVIAEGDLSNRPRYAKIRDILERQGRPNLVEFIRGRVGDVGYADENNPNAAKEEGLVFYGADGRVIRDSERRIVKGDSFIANAGFRPDLDPIFRPLLDSVGNGRRQTIDDPRRDARVPFTLPTNPEVSVGQTLPGYENILFVGTGAADGFDATAKIDQYPQSAREAYLRNTGVGGGAAAVGFRSNDVRAAVRNYLDRLDTSGVEPFRLPRERDVRVGGGQTDWSLGEIVRVPIAIEREKLKVSNDTKGAENDLLSGILNDTLKSGLPRLSDADGPFTGEFTFTVSPGGGQLNILFTSSTGDGSLSPEVRNEIQRFCQNRFFQNYAFAQYEGQRRDPKIGITVAYRSGKLDYKNTFVTGA